MQFFSMLSCVAAVSAANVLSPVDILELSASPAPSPGPSDVNDWGPPVSSVDGGKLRYTAYEMELRVKKAVAGAKKEAYAKVAADKAQDLEDAKTELAKRKGLNFKREKDISTKIVGLEKRAVDMKAAYQQLEGSAAKKELDLAAQIAAQTQTNEQGRISAKASIQAEETKADLKKAKDIATYGFGEAEKAKKALKKALDEENSGFKKAKNEAAQNVDGILNAAKAREDVIANDIAKKKTELSYGKQEAVEASKKAKDTRMELDAQVLLKIKAEEEAAVAGAQATEKYALKIAGQKAKIEQITTQTTAKSKELVEGKQFAVKWNCVQKDLNTPRPAPAPSEIGGIPLSASPSPSPA